MKLRLTLAALALFLVGAATASAPRVTAHAYLVQNGTTGDVLLASRARAKLPIASITKLMTVLVTLQHARLSDVVAVSGRAAAGR